eukprot:Colp12_sorted_trinity150504_noHs@16231
MFGKVCKDAKLGTSEGQLKHLLECKVLGESWGQVLHSFCMPDGYALNKDEVKKLLSELSRLSHRNLPNELDVYYIPANLPIGLRHLLVMACLLKSSKFEYINRYGDIVTAGVDPEIKTLAKALRKDIVAFVSDPFPTDPLPSDRTIIEPQAVVTK